MPPKKAAAKKAPEQDENAITPENLVQHYKTACKLLGVTQEYSICSQIVEEREDGSPFTQLMASDLPLGPAGTRALMLGVGGKEVGMAGEPYSLLKSMRIWRCAAGDDGARAVADLLKSFKEDKMNLLYLEMVDNLVGPRGSLYLGDALGYNGNKTLVTLNLNYNHLIGDEGCENLYQGLQHNTTIRKLGLAYCRIGPAGALSIAKILSIPTVELQEINLRGNSIQSKGLQSLALVLKRNKKLTTLDLSDNQLSGFPPTEDLLTALDAFGAMMATTTTLETVAFDLNTIGVEGGKVLEPYLETNTQIKSFTVDTNLPTELFGKLFKGGKGGKKGKKGKKKK